MSVLPTACQSALNNALTGAGFTRAATWQAWSAGVLGTASNITVTVESDQTATVWVPAQDGNQMMRVRTVQVRLVGSTSTARHGDVLNYDGVDFTISAINGTDDLPMWRAESKMDYGRGPADRFRAEGRT